MAAILPPSRPKLTEDNLRMLLQQHDYQPPHAPVLIGIRGYYRRSMGDPKSNDRGIYDDAMILLSPSVFATFNANVDPSITRLGIATLRPGLWSYKLGTHGLSKPVEQRYRALVQAARVTVSRDGHRTPDSGWFGINIHRGSNSSTSSLGCQTIPPAQWPAFIALVESEMKRHSAKTIPYLLTHEF
jgi:hypothetical protein